MRRQGRGVAFIGLSLLGACSSVSLEREQFIRIETPQAEGAYCSIEDSRGYHWWARSTPKVISIEKGYPPLTVTCTQSGFYKTTLEVNQRYDPQVVGDFAADKIGYVLPAWKGSADQYPSTITVWMRPTQFKTFEDMETWERQLWQYLRDEEERMVKTDKTLKGYASRMYTRMEKAWEAYDPPLKRVKRAKPLFDYVDPPAELRTPEDEPEFPKRARKSGFYSQKDRLWEKQVESEGDNRPVNIVPDVH